MFFVPKSVSSQINVEKLSKFTLILEKMLGYVMLGRIRPVPKWTATCLAKISSIANNYLLVVHDCKISKIIFDYWKECAWLRYF